MDREQSVEVIIKLGSGEGDSPVEKIRQALQACAVRNGISIEPLHPSASDPELASFFRTTVAPERVKETIQSLSSCPGVDGVYAKPRGEAPL